MQIIHFNENSFKEALASNKTILVDFYATWCGPCKMLSPVLEEIRQEVSEDIVIGKIDVDENFDIARSYGIFSVQKGRGKFKKYWFKAKTSNS